MTKFHWIRMCTLMTFGKLNSHMNMNMMSNCLASIVSLLISNLIPTWNQHGSWEKKYWKDFYEIEWQLLNCLKNWSYSKFNFIESSATIPRVPVQYSIIIFHIILTASSQASVSKGKTGKQTPRNFWRGGAQNKSDATVQQQQHQTFFVKSICNLIEAKFRFHASTWNKDESCHGWAFGLLG